MREIVFDTETTGLSPADGHRIVEIGGIELINQVPTGESRQWYINPDRDMPEEAFRVHGLSEEFLADKPRFHEIVEDFLAFVGDARLVIHNASFDMRFINAELAALDRPPIPMEQSLDTLALARRRHPGAQASLDALCRRYGIDNSGRTKHGALLDAELLAEVYLELLGGRQRGLTLAENAGASSGPASAPGTASDYSGRTPRPLQPDAAELAAHRAFIEAEIDSPIWFAEEKPDSAAPDT